jgi:iron-sulfur cluster repair protein YtfE (RIC family)
MEDAMSEGCRCGCGHATATVSAEQTVEQARSRPGALEVLQRLGVNHCCGAHLTLREAAAAAGVELPVLLRALDEATAVTP